MSPLVLFDEMCTFVKAFEVHVPFIIIQFYENAWHFCKIHCISAKPIKGTTICMLRYSRKKMIPTKSVKVAFYRHFEHGRKMLIAQHGLLLTTRIFI